MTTLNRSSYWTLHNGSELRVKKMTIAQIQCAIIELAEMESNELDNDPYVVQLLALETGTYGFFNEPIHKKDGFFLDDWHTLFNNEIEKRLKFLYGLPIRHAPKEIQQNFLVKWFKSWYYTQ